MKPGLRVALLGCGVVGTEVVRLLNEQADDLAARVGAPLELAGIAVRRPDRVRAGIDPGLLTTDAQTLVTRDDVDIVIEVIGGIEPSQDADAGGDEDRQVGHHREQGAAGRGRGDAVRGGAGVRRRPVLRGVRGGRDPAAAAAEESLVGDHVHRVLGIVNGTTNYVLDQMDTHGAGFNEALEEAQALGYAEADPTADVEGFDAAAKAAILAQLAFHTPVTAADVHREGITEVSAADVAGAQGMDCVVKLLAICERIPSRDGRNGRGVSVRVYPAMIPRSHPLASVREAYNAVFVEAESAGSLMFYGAGAGGAPTASAILGDLVAVARNVVGGTPGPVEVTYAKLPVLPMGETVTRYYVEVDVTDEAGVLATVAEEFARHGVSIQAVRQVGSGEEAQLVVVTHRAPDAALSATVAGLRELEIVRGVTSVMRVEGDE
ncbi:homoserine dehydrogenase [Actinomadura luteofluorescens]